MNPDEARLALLELSDTLRDVDDTAAISYVAGAILGKWLRVSRAGYGTIDPAAETITVERDWNAPGVTTIAGTLHFRQHGSYIDDLKRGETVLCVDAFTDPRTAATADVLAAISARSFINMPITERGGFVALLYVNQAQSRAWTPAELAFMREVADRTRAVTERRRAEQGLRDLAASLERQVEARTRERDRLLENANDLIATAGLDGFLKEVNPAWTRVLGWTRAELLGRPFVDIVDPIDHGATAEVMTRLAAREAVTDFVDHVVTKDGQRRTIMWAADPDPEGAIFYIVGRDITEQHAAEEQLRQAQKMEAVGQLTGGVAHDFNNLLTVIRSSVDLLKRPGLSEERRQRYIEAIANTTTRAARLTSQLLAFARRQALKPEIFDVGESVRAISDMVRTLTGSRIRIDTRVPDRPCFVNADPSQFDTALVNMAVNARDAMHGEGTLTIAVTTTTAVPAIRSHPAQAGDFVTVSIGDTGGGISAENIDRIFEPFFTTKGVGQGTGLGLSQVFGFSKQSGGEVGVESESGRGARFTLYLPRVEGEDRQDDIQSGAFLPSDGHGTCVLVVEDNADVGLFATQTLEELGYRSVLAGDAQAALAELDTDAERFDVVFSDVVMPGMNGIELAEQVRRRFADLPVVLTSGYSHVLAQNGTHGFELLHKPYSIEQLSRMLEKAARWRRLKRVLDR